MVAPWTIMFWLQLSLQLEPADGIGVIASYRGITIFLTVRDHVICLNNGDSNFLGPRIKGLEKEAWIFLGLTRDESRIALYVNGVKVMEIIESEIVYKLKDFRIEIGERAHIKKIEQDLSEWLEKRKLMFKVKEETTDNFLILSVRDQERQLESRVQALEDMIDALHHGKNYFFERKFMGGVHAERAQIF